MNSVLLDVNKKVKKDPHVSAWSNWVCHSGVHPDAGEGLGICFQYMLDI